MRELNDLNIREVKELFAAADDIQYFSDYNGKWFEVHDGMSINHSLSYRVKPKVLDWNEIAFKYNYAMTDNQGRVWFYEDEPTNPDAVMNSGAMRGDCWYEFIGGPENSLISRNGLFVPWVDMPDAEKVKVLEAHFRGKTIEVRAEKTPWHVTSDPLFSPQQMYRIRQDGAVEAMQIDWTAVGYKYNYAAMDKDGRVWAYRSEPYYSGCDECWRSGDYNFAEIGRRGVIAKGTVPAKDSLIKRPEGI